MFRQLKGCTQSRRYSSLRWQRYKPWPGRRLWPLNLEVFEFLQQLSIPWLDLGIRCSRWDDLKKAKAARQVNKALRGEIPTPPNPAALIAMEEENRKRFFELACAWLRQHDKEYFPKVVAAAEAISRFEVPEPKSSTLSLSLSAPETSEQAGQVLEHKILIRSWPHHELFIGQQVGGFEESETLDYTHFGFEGCDLRDHLKEVVLHLCKERKDLGDSMGRWRVPFSGDYSKYNETWIRVEDADRVASRPRHTGAEVLSLFVLLAADEKSKRSFSDLQKFLVNTPQRS